MIVNILFFIFAALAVGSAISVIVRRNPVHSGVSLLLTFVSFAAIYILLNAQFIAAIQITIYAGAILVLVLFVIMLLNLRDPGVKYTKLLFGTGQGIAAMVFVGLLVLEMATLFFLKYIKIAGASGDYSNAKIAETGAIQSLAEVLFTKFLYPFEVASVLLLVALIGAVSLTRRRKNIQSTTEEGGES
jgi:NADH-quinone oxidoreductase subunit J